MKTNLFISILSFICFSCTINQTLTDAKSTVKTVDSDTTQTTALVPSEIMACGVTHPEKNLPWLAELIEKAETDKTGNYLGRIWLEKFKGDDIFVTDMMLGSGGIAYWFFDCSGNHFISKDLEYEICPACKFVGNHHVCIENKEDFQSFVLNIRKEIVIYSPF